MRVAVVERERRFRDRVRGEALMPWGTALAGELGIAGALPESGSHPLPIWQTYVDRQPRPPYDWRPDVPTGDGLWGVCHPGLQEVLLSRAEASGAVVLRPAKALRPRRGRPDFLIVPVASERGVTEIRTRLLVGADGSDSGVRGWIGAKTVRDPVHHAIGGCLIEGVDLDPEAAHIAYYPGGAAFIFRQASGRARAYLFARPDDAAALRGPDAASGLIAACAAALPDGALRHARAVGPAAFFPGADVFASRIRGDGIVLIGDAAGANDPTQGQGVALVFKDVSELSRLLLANDDWDDATGEFSRIRPRWYEPLRAYAAWMGPLVTDLGPEADAARLLADRARERDPWSDGYGAIHTLGPDGLPVTDAARRRVLGDAEGDEVVEGGMTH